MVNLFQSNPNDFQYILDSLGKDVLINNQPVKAVISNSTLSTEVDDKKISTLTAISRGNIVHYNNEDWIILSEVNGQRNGRYRAYMRVCDYSIKFNFKGIIKEFSTIIDGKVFDVQTGQFMTLPNSKILVTLQENTETLRIEIGQRFIKMGRAWAVEGIDRTQKGLLILWCKQDQINPAVDDVVNEIADYVDTSTPSPNLLSLIISGDPDIRTTQTKTWTIALYDNAALIPIQPTTWSVTDINGNPTDIVSIISQTHESITIKGNVLGKFILGCTLVSDATIKTTIEVRVKGLI